MPSTEYYATRQYFTDLVGFTPYSFTNFINKHGIKKTDAGYPIFEIMKALKDGGSESIDDVEKSLKHAKLARIRLETSIKRRDHIKRDLAVDRMRTTLMAISTKISYGAKQAAPRVIGVMNVIDVENIIIGCFESSMDMLLEEAERLIDWEKYELDIQSDGEELAERPEENLSFGDDEEDPFASEI